MPVNGRACQPYILLGAFRCRIDPGNPAAANTELKVSVEIGTPRQTSKAVLPFVISPGIHIDA